MSATSTTDDRVTAGQSAEDIVDKASGAMRDLADQTTEIADQVISKAAN